MQQLAVLVALGFAAARVAQLIVHDSILDAWRDRLDTWHMNGIRPGKRNRARKFVVDLLGCVLCTGFHASWLTVLTYLLATGSWQSGVDGFVLFGIQSFAVAGVQVTLNLRWDR